MKTILYIGATLMIGACIYGFVDYKKTSRNKEFTKMYDSKETKDPILTNDKTKEMTTNTDGEATITKKDDVINEKTAIDLTLKENSSVATNKPVKKLSYKLFSRAPLEEKYIDKELKIEPPKTIRPDAPVKNK